MPELPEVETVRRVLDKDIVGLTITDIKIKYDNIIDYDIDEFKKNIIGKKIVSTERLGKFLIFNLNEGNLISHLRMEGKYFYLPKDTFDNKHVHVIYYFDNDTPRQRNIMDSSRCLSKVLPSPKMQCFPATLSMGTGK